MTHQPSSSHMEPSLEVLQAWAKQRATWPSPREWNDYFAVDDHLGGPRRRAPDQATCLEAIREAAKTLGPSMTKRTYDQWAKAEPGRPRLNVVLRRCRGRWTATKASALLLQNPSTTPQIWSKRQTLDALRKATEVLGDPFGEEAYEAWRGPEHPSVEIIRMHWGSLNTARTAAALMEPNPGGVIHDAETVPVGLDRPARPCLADASQSRSV